MRAIILAALVATIAMLESKANHAVENSAAQLFLVATPVLLLFAIAHLVANLTAAAVKSSYQDQTRCLQFFTIFERVFAMVWVVNVAITFFLTNWIPLVRYNWGWNGWFLVDELILLTPVLIPLIGSWFARYEVERAIDESIGGTQRVDYSASDQLQFVLLHIRHYLGLTFVPLLLFMGIADFAAWMNWSEGSPQQYLVYILPLVALLVISPLILRRIWKTDSLPSGALRDRLTRISHSQGLKIRDILVWRTGQYVVNAAVAGIVPWCRYLMLSDGLLKHLSEQDIRAIFLHESGHIRRGHNLLRVLTLAIPVLLVVSIEAFAPEISTAFCQSGRFIGISPSLFPIVLVPALSVVYGVLVVGGLCRAFELEADFWACERLVPSETAISPDAANEYATALINLTAASGQDPSKSSWLHPSIDDRVSFLHCAAQSPCLVRQFQFTMKMLRLMIWGGALVIPIALAVSATA